MRIKTVSRILWANSLFCIFGLSWALINIDLNSEVKLNLDEQNTFEDRFFNDELKLSLNDDF